MIKIGDIFEIFGCKWIIDDIYNVPDAEMMSESNPYGFWHKKRYKAHVIEAPDNYTGVREIIAALTEEE